MLDENATAGQLQGGMYLKSCHRNTKHSLAWYEANFRTTPEYDSLSPCC